MLTKLRAPSNIAGPQITLGRRTNVTTRRAKRSVKIGYHRIVSPQRRSKGIVAKAKIAIKRSSVGGFRLKFKNNWWNKKTVRVLHSNANNRRTAKWGEI